MFVDFRYRHEIVVYEHKLYIFGGGNSTCCCSLDKVCFPYFTSEPLLGQLLVSDSLEILFIIVPSDSSIRSENKGMVTGINTAG